MHKLATKHEDVIIEDIDDFFAALEETTCKDCSSNETCIHAFGGYNTAGKCAVK